MNSLRALEDAEASHTLQAIGLQAALAFPASWTNRARVKQEIRLHRQIAKSIRRHIRRVGHEDECHAARSAE